MRYAEAVCHLNLGQTKSEADVLYLVHALIDMRIRIGCQMNLCGGGLENEHSADYAGGMSILAENIRSLRLRFDSQTEFGEKIGVGQSTVVRWESGSAPKPDNLLSLAKFEGVSIEQLITVPLERIPARKAGGLLPSEADFARMISSAMQEVPPGSRLADYPPIVAANLRDQLELFLKHGGFRGSQEESSAAGSTALSPAPTTPDASAKPRTS